MVDLHTFILWVPDSVLTPSGSEFELQEDEGGDESDRCPDVVLAEGISSKRRTKGLPKATQDAITQACHNVNYPATPAAGGKHACKALSDKPSVPG